MPTVVISTKSVQDVTPSTVTSAPGGPPPDFKDKSQETTIAEHDGDAAIAGGSVPDGLRLTRLQSAPTDGSILRAFNIEDVPVINDPRQWSQRRKVSDEVIPSAVLVLMAAVARYPRHHSLCGPRPYYRRFHLST